MTGQQLKNSILQMAVQGKLVPQDPNDEPASVLLERIRKEKEQLIKEGKIKKDKNPSYIFRGADNLPYEKVENNEPVCIADEVPFDIPDTWEWARVSTICSKLVDGDHNPPKGVDFKTKYIMASSTNINNDTIVDLEKVRYLTEEIFQKENERTQVKMGDIFFTSVGSLGRSCVYTGGLNICFQRSVSVISTFIFNYYLKYCLDSGYVQQKIIREATGTAQKGFYLNQLATVLIPIPPEKEQQRIVAQYLKVAPLIDDYSDTEISLLNLNHEFPELLKKSILQEAVQGKLVPQDETDEPASILLERIRAEKSRLVKEGKIKKDKNESVIFRRDNSHYEKQGSDEVCIDDYLPFGLPDNWQWERLINLYNFIDYRGSTPTKIESGVPLVTAKNVKKGYIDYKIRDYISNEEYCTRQSRGISQKGDILFTTEAPLGNVALADLEQFSAGQRLITLQQYTEHPLINNTLIMYFMLSDCFQNQLIEQSTGTTVKGIKADKLKQLWIPVPPLQEQVRIIEQIRKVFESCVAL